MIPPASIVKPVDTSARADWLETAQLRLIAPWIERGLVANASAAEDWLRPIVAAALDGRASLATWSKALTIRQLMQAGRVYFGEDIGFLELLPRYPFDTNDDTASGA